MLLSIACTGTDTCSNGPPGELELRYRGGGGFKPPQIEKHALTSIRKGRFSQI